MSQLVESLSSMLRVPSFHAQHCIILSTVALACNPSIEGPVDQQFKANLCYLGPSPLHRKKGRMRGKGKEVGKSSLG